jgi:hypothetical protein
LKCQIALKKNLRGIFVARKIVKVYLTPEQKRLLERIRQTLGMDESEILRHAFMELATSLGLVTERVHGRI